MTESSFRQLLLRFAFVPIVSLCGFLAILGLQLREIATRRIAGAQATSVLLQGYRLQKTMIDEETGVRGYLATKDADFLQPYREASNRFTDELTELQSLASTDPSLTPRITSITENFNRLDKLNQTLLSTSSPNDTNLPNEATVGLLQQQKQAIDNLRAEFAELISRENGIRELQRAEITRILNQLPIFAIGGGLIVTALLIWHGIYRYREITRAFRLQINQAELQRDSLQTTLQSIGDAVLVCDSSARITLINPTAEQLTGWTRDEAIGRPLSEVFRIIHENTRLPVESSFEKVKRLGTTVTIENHIILIRKDGTEVPIDDCGAPIRSSDTTLAGVILVFRSVAERRHIANLLHKSEERFQSIYNASLEYIGILSVEGKVLDCNRSSLEFAGNTREDVLGKYFWECPWFIYTPGMPESVRAAVERATTGHPTRTELALIRPTGETVYFDFSLIPVRDSDGKVIYLVPEARDITDLKQAQGALVQSEKLAAVGRLASSIAHEINNPLEAVTNLLYLARYHSHSPETEKYLHMADQELRRVSVIANQTLRFHRQAASPEPIGASELFSTVLSIYEGKLRNSGITVEVSHRTHEPIVCFAGDVRQVLNNLVGNAIDAMSHGGRLLIRSHASTDGSTNRRGIVLTVADTGSGIDTEDLKRIFEPFFTTKGISGTGLGLWVSKEVVTRHKGTLTVRSSRNSSHSGTVFRFFLPFA
jgi:PAS domain S-box-containing protein